MSYLHTVGAAPATPETLEAQFSALQQEFAEAMVVRARLVGEIATLRSEQGNLKDILDDNLHAGVDADEQPVEYARLALRHFMRADELRQAERQVHHHDRLNNPTIPKGWLGKEVEVTALPAGRPISKLKLDRFGELQGLGKFSYKVRGTLERVHFNLETGGSILLAGRGRVRFGADPIVNPRSFDPGLTLREI